VSASDVVHADFVVDRAAEIATCAGPAPRRGPEQNQAGVVRGGSLAARNGRLVFVGSAEQCRRVVRLQPGGVTLDASGCAVIPGFVDAHTHAVFAGDRRGELRRRLAGESYQQIAAAGGGILATVAATRVASEADLRESAVPRLRAMLECGTTTAEVKSGYGLTLDGELKMLRVIHDLAETQPVELVPTFLGAHDVPPEFRADPAAYAALVARRMIPAVAAARLAESCDVFCEHGAFSVEHSRTVLEAAAAAGLLTRVHADEFAESGGARLAAAAGARSADHLVFVSPQSAAALAQAGTVATLLPAASLYLKLGRYAPARMLIDEGVPVALGSDFNPGPGLSVSMPFVLTLACFAMGMTLEESLVAATLNAAYAVNRHERVGSLEVGKQMDAVVLDGPLETLLASGAPAVRAVVKKGRIVYESSDARPAARH
jgi:imidazolonepropionase